MQKVFINEGKKFISERRRIFMYIPFFMLITFMFLFLIYMVYSGGLSIGKPFQVPNNIYYEVTIVINSAESFVFFGDGSSNFAVHDLGRVMYQVDM